jgi:hypothetical protein
MSIKDMAYKMDGDPTSPNVYRLERGKEYMRAGKILPAIPQFKSLQLYMQAAGSVPKNFQVTMTPKRVRWPIPTEPGTQTGS